MDFGLHWQQRPQHSNRSGRGSWCEGSRHSLGLFFSRSRDGFFPHVGAPINAIDALSPGQATVVRQTRIGMIAAKEWCAYIRIRSGRETRCSIMKRRKRTDSTKLLIEAMLDFALVAGFLSAIGFLVSVTGRLVF
jgi:hypothetical protein